MIKKKKLYLSSLIQIVILYYIKLHKHMVQFYDNL